MEEDPFGFDDGGGGGGGGEEEADPFQQDDAEEEDAEGAGYDAFGDAGDAVGDGADDDFGTHTFDNTAEDFAGEAPPAGAQELGEQDAAAAVDVAGAAPEDDDAAALRQFESQWRARIEEKEAAEKVKRDSMRETAAAELKEFYAGKESSLAGKKAGNRTAEQEQQAAFAEALSSENPWEQVALLVDMSGNGAEAAATARLRSLLIQLKNSPVGAK